MGRVLRVGVALVALAGVGLVGTGSAGAGVDGVLVLTTDNLRCLLPGSVTFDWIATSNAAEALTIDDVDTSAIAGMFSPNPIPALGTAASHASGSAPNLSGETVTITVTYHGETIPTSTAM